MWIVQALFVSTFLGSLHYLRHVSGHPTNDALYPFHDEDICKIYNKYLETYADYSNIFLRPFFGGLSSPSIKEYKVERAANNLLLDRSNELDLKAIRIPVERSKMFKDAQVNFITDEIKLKTDGQKKDLNIRSRYFSADGSLFGRQPSRRRVKKDLHSGKSTRRYLRPSFSSYRNYLTDDYTNRKRINELRTKLGLSKWDLISSLNEQYRQLKKKRKASIVGRSKKGRTTIKTNTKFRFHIG